MASHSDPGLAPDAAARLHAARELAVGAGELLLAHLRARGDTDPTVEWKGPRDLVTAADKASEALLVREIRARFPGDAVLAEEGVASAAGRRDGPGDWCWVIDPLDGTTNFVHGHPHFAVSLGILYGDEPTLGVVHAPLLGLAPGGESYWGAVGYGAWCDGRSLRVSGTTRLADALVCTGFPYALDEPGLNDNLDNFRRVALAARGIRRCGSASIDLAYTAAGIYDAFWELHLPPWDVAAGVAIASGAGAEISDLGGGGGPLHGREILVTNGRVTAEVRALLDGIGRGSRSPRDGHHP